MSEKKAKFTVIDVIIMLIVIAAIAVGAYKILPSITGGGKQEKTDRPGRPHGVAPTGINRV